jgi:hypothetical protein
MGDLVLKGKTIMGMNDIDGLPGPKQNLIKRS